MALGNTDAHAKNYALLHDGDAISLAPLYDVVPALEIIPQTLVMGMRVSGRIRIDRIGKDQIVDEARAWGIPKQEAALVLNDTLERLRDGIDYAEGLYPQASERHAAPTLERLAALLL